MQTLLIHQLIKENNYPNRITSTLKSNTKTAREFHCFTSDPINEPVVLVSTSPKMAKSLEFKAKIEQVDSYYLQRDE